MEKLKRLKFNYRLIDNKDIVIKHRSGKKAIKVVAIEDYIKKGLEYPIVCFFDTGSFQSYLLNGRAFKNQVCKTDLIMFEKVYEPEKRKIYGVYNDKGYLISSGACKQSMKIIASAYSLKVSEFIEE